MNLDLIDNKYLKSTLPPNFRKKSRVSSDPFVVREILATTTPATKILDVGPGSGKYGYYLRQHRLVDAVEIFPDYVTIYGLERIYNRVYISDIRNFDVSPYDYIIYGDIAEHLPVTDFQRLLEQHNQLGQQVLVVFPWLYEQDILENNPAEIHHQPDLTPAVVAERYPSLTMIYYSKLTGVYVNNITHK